MSVSYANMSAVAIQGIKEQQIVINQLLQAVSKLDETNKDLQNQIKELKGSIKNNTN